MIKITDVKPSEGKEGYKIVKLSNQRDIEIPEESVFKYGLYIDAEFDEDEFDNIMLNVYTDEAYSKALLFVYRKMRTRKETELKLRQSGYSDECIENVIDRLEERGYINDEIYAGRYVRTNIKTSKKSSRLIFHELMQKGVNEETAMNALDESGIDDVRIAEELLKKKFSSLIKSKNFTVKDVIRMKKFLYNKGFEIDIINNVVGKISGNTYDEEYF